MIRNTSGEGQIGLISDSMTVPHTDEDVVFTLHYGGIDMCQYLPICIFTEIIFILHVKVP